METVQLSQELHQNFIDFSYEANSQRAFPDARDGLKPGQRACLWEMWDKKYKSNKPHVKNAKIAGGVIANWWPHGDTAIYDTFARMSQQWINNCPEVDWHGENGSQIISNEPAAMRYTEARLSKFSEEGLFAGIDKHNVPMIQNFSQDAEWPEVLPALVPRLLINGSQGIGVTIAQTWLPHNPADIWKVLKKYVEDGVLDYSNLRPDFPSGGIIINDQSEIRKIYETGKGKVVLRARTEIKGNSIIITEFPYQVYIEPWLEDVKKLMADGTITGIDDINNKSGRNGIKVEVECDGNPQVVLAQLFKETDLQKNYNANQYALVGKTPKLLNLKEYFDIFIAHNKDCVRREYEYKRQKDSDRLHVVIGLLACLLDLDRCIELIKTSDSSDVARARLETEFRIDSTQAKAVLAMRLSSLAKLERQELMDEKVRLEASIEDSENIINTPSRQVSIYAERAMKVFSTIAKTASCQYEYVEITKEKKEKAEIIPEDVVVVITKTGLIKRIPRMSFKTQKRGGKGVKTPDEAILTTLSTNTCDTLMFFTNKGKMYKILVDKVPVGDNKTKGVPLATLINLEPNERVDVVNNLYSNTKAEYVVFFTKNGLIKKTKLSEFTDIKKSTGTIAIKIKEGDEIANVTFLNEEDVIVVTKNGMGIRFKTDDMAPTGRNTSGVKSIKLNEGDEVLQGLPIHKESDYLLVVTEDGLGKRIPLSEFTRQGRNGKGLSFTKHMVSGVAFVDPDDEILITGKGTGISLKASDISVSSRAAEGIKCCKITNITGVIKL